MFAIASGLTSKINIKPKSISIENFVFRLHYRFTVWLLLIFCSMICVGQYNKNKIRCTHSDPTDSKKQLERVIETYCFFMMTFTVPRHNNLSTGNMAFAGVGPVVKDEETVAHKYYQWVPYVLALQAFSFYIPHFIWRAKEGGRLKEIVGQLTLEKYLNDEVANSYAKFFPKRMRMYRSWLKWLVLCEILNLINVCVQVYLTDLFLGGNFINLGSLVYEHYGSEEFNPFDVIFPKVSKCTFQKYGPAGSLQTHDAICILSLNIINEKMYLVLWYWYIFLFTASVSILIHRLLSVILYKSHVSYNTSVLIYEMMAAKPSKRVLQKIMEKLDYSEWFFLQALATNLDPEIAESVLDAAAEASFHSSPTSDESSPDNSPKSFRKRNLQMHPQAQTLLPIDKEKGMP